MISFSILDGENKLGLAEPYLDREFYGELCEMLRDLSELSYEGAEVAVCILTDALLVRIYDNGEYIFMCPIGLSSGWDFKGSLIAISEYCTRELLPFRISDVPRDELMVITELFSHVDASAYRDDEDLFFVKVNNECDMLDKFPSYSYQRVTLGEIKKEHKDSYAKLCSDAELNRYWGYDVRCDNPNADADYYLAVAEREFNDGAALTLGIYTSGELIGEAVVYGFDFLGGGHIGVRLLSEYHGQGLGQESTLALIGLCRDIGLSTLYAEVLLENEASVRMTSKCMDETFRDECKVYFKKSI